MKQRNDRDNKLDVFNPFLGLQPMLSPRSRTLPPIKRSSLKDSRTSKVYPSKIPIRIPFPKEAQQTMALLNGEVNSGIDDAFPQFSSNLQQRNRLCAKTTRFQDEWARKTPEKEFKKKYILDENSETIHGVETSSFPSSVQERFEKFGDKMSQEKVKDTDLRLMKSSSWANSFDSRTQASHKTMPRTENSFHKQLSFKNEWGEKRSQKLTKRHTRSLGRHLQPLQEKITEYPEVKTRGRRENKEVFLSLGSPPSVIIDKHEGSGGEEVEHETFLQNERDATERKPVCRRYRNVETVKGKRPCPGKRKTQSLTEKNTGIPCKPRLHKIHTLPLTPKTE